MATKIRGIHLGTLSLFVFFLSCQLPPTTEAANIVFFFGVSTYSHRIPAWPLVEALAEKGHNVTFVSSYPAKNPNPKVRDYVPKALTEWLEGMEKLDNVFVERKRGNIRAGWKSLPMFGTMACEAIYKDEEYISWIKTTKVDLVFIDGLFNDCAYGMAHYWGAKMISFQTSAPFSYFMNPFGLPDETSSIPSMELFYPADMTLVQRITNGVLPIFWTYIRKWMYFPKLEQITKEKLGMSEMASFEEIERRICLSFVNTYYGEGFAMSLPPNIIPVGGIAITEKRTPLPKELNEFLKKSDGFIYMSFGTFADFFQFDKSVQRVFIDTMNNFPRIQFVWKIGNNSLAKDLTKGNVYMSKWMPQQDILAHPKAKAFITHSGLMSIQEAIYNSVPLISFPIFAEQDYNAERIHRKENGIRLEITTVTKEELQEAISKVLLEPKYRNNMKTISKLFKERPQKPLETALWWTEFVLRHSQEELTALRPLSVGQPWWKRRQLDVWATIMGTIIALSGLLLYVILKLVNFAFGNKKDSSSGSNINSQKKAQ